MKKVNTEQLLLETTLANIQITQCVIDVVKGIINDCKLENETKGDLYQTTIPEKLEELMALSKSFTTSLQTILTSLPKDQIPIEKSLQ